MSEASSSSTSTFTSGCATPTAAESSLHDSSLRDYEVAFCKRIENRTNEELETLLKLRTDYLEEIKARKEELKKSRSPSTTTIITLRIEKAQKVLALVEEEMKEICYCREDCLRVLLEEDVRRVFQPKPR